MSEEETDAVDATSCCALCGIAEIDDIKLKDCDDCDLVKYCSDECQQIHKPEHEEGCKKRVAELRDELLFKQPESNHWGDCPICSLPLPLLPSKSTLMGCCSKVICDGCECANWMRELEMGLRQSCPFCRKPAPVTKEEDKRRRMKRIEANDPVAMCHQGGERQNKGDYRSAFEHYIKAAELGSVEAHFRLGNLYHYGKGVEKDEGMYWYHLEEGAIGGHPEARFNLGCHENKHGSAERAVRHWIIAATLGEDQSMKCLMEGFKQGFVEKDVLAAALRAHKAAVDAMKSSQREAAEAFYRENKNLRNY